MNLENEIPEVLHTSMKDFIESNPDWDQYRLMSSALAYFLFQNGSKNKYVRDIYLNDLFIRSWMIVLLNFYSFRKSDYDVDLLQPIPFKAFLRQNIGRLNLSALGIIPTLFKPGKTLAITNDMTECN